MDVPINFGSAEKVYHKLSELFSEAFGLVPDYFVKTPGRVNLIGEHIDYCGYPVLPMAVQQSIRLAVRETQDGVLHLKNANPKYESFKCAINSFEFTTSDGPPEWYKYFLCGVKGAAEELSIDSGTAALKGMMVLVSGDIPPASGLSSSSALVSSAILLACYANQLSIDKVRLAAAAAKCERYIGTCGGGMDQAIAFLAEPGTAQYIQWNPLKANTIQMPQNAFFVIANSLSEANKAATPDFNQRVIECQLGCRLMAKKASLNWREVGKFALLQKTLNFSLAEMLELAKGCLSKDCYSRRDLLDEFGITEEELDEKLLTPNTKKIPVFYIRQRALHVFQEARRVDRFRVAAEEGDLEEMSLLMRDSHRSLAELFECSHKNLDELVRLAEGVGVVGCRLTGAGWGGCVVALCHSIEKGQELIAELKEKYYSKLPHQSLQNVVFMTHPDGGAQVILK